MNETISKGKALANYISQLDYGSIIHYQEIESVISEGYGTSRYYRAITNAKKILEAQGKAIKWIGNKDYQVLYPGDYSDAYTREVRIAKGHIKRGGKILKGAPKNDMTVDELIAFNNVSDFHARLQASISGSYVEVKRLAERKHPLEQT